jgi:hypothetical protein
MNISVPHSTPKRRLSATKQVARELGDSQDFSPGQLSPPPDTPQNPEVLLFKKRRKPQISCIPGISLTSQRKYQVKVGDRILGDKLTLQEALELAKGGTR